MLHREYFISPSSFLRGIWSAERGALGVEEGLFDRVRGEGAGGSLGRRGFFVVRSRSLAGPHSRYEVATAESTPASHDARKVCARLAAVLTLVYYGCRGYASATGRGRSSRPGPARGGPPTVSAIRVVSSIMSFPEPTARSCLVGRGSGHPTCSWSPRAADPPRETTEPWLDAGPGAACKSLALPPTLTYIVIHGSYS